MSISSLRGVCFSSFYYSYTMPCSLLQTVYTRIRRRVLWRLIWVYIVCLCPFCGTPDIYWLQQFLTALLSFLVVLFKLESKWRSNRSRYSSVIVCGLAHITSTCSFRFSDFQLSVESSSSFHYSVDIFYLFFLFIFFFHEIGNSYSDWQFMCCMILILKDKDWVRTEQVLATLHSNSLAIYRYKMTLCYGSVLFVCVVLEDSCLDRLFTTESEYTNKVVVHVIIIDQCNQTARKTKSR